MKFCAGCQFTKPLRSFLAGTKYLPYCLECRQNTIRQQRLVPVPHQVALNVAYVIDQIGKMRGTKHRGCDHDS